MCIFLLISGIPSVSVCQTVKQGYIKADDSLSMQRDYVSPYPATIFFVPKCCQLFTSTVYMYTEVHFWLDLFMEANNNNLNPDQTAPKEQSGLGPYCLQYRLL